jgi:hypothetical protein
VRFVGNKHRCAGVKKMRLGLVGAAVVLFLGAQCAVGLAAPVDGGGLAELSKLNAEIMHRPKDTALNLRYALLAEQLGQPRLALAAYERILSYDPLNAAALDGVYRVRRAIQPNTTQWLLGLGLSFESNPAYVPTPAKGDYEAFANLTMDDERTLGDTRWRTLADLNGIAHDNYEYLDYGHAGATTGPIFELMPGLTVNPAVGAGTAYVDNHFFYGEGIAQATFEAYPNGAYESVRIRGAFRDYDQFFVPDQYGGYVDATGKFTVPLNIPNVTFSLSPWVRWASIEGSLGAANPLVGIQPGDYTEYGGRLDGYFAFEDWVIFGGNISASQRDYRDELVVGGTNERADTTYAPGASIIFPHLMQYQNTLRFDYTYMKDNSNDATKSFQDNIVTATIQRTF